MILSDEPLDRIVDFAARRCCQRGFFGVRSQSSPTRSPVSSRVQTTSRSVGVSQALDRRSGSSAVSVLSRIDTASLTLEIVRPWGWNTQPLRFPTARLPAPFGVRKGLSPEKTREIASPIRFRGWEPECVIRSGRRTASKSVCGLPSLPPCEAPLSWFGCPVGPGWCPVDSWPSLRGLLSPGTR